ncbi:Uncharacterized protein TCM_036349 [Theobroma cacao]|uniref:Uncharacterized protein n=1 Tax=Theobroma cacao TaxID=3641 RepID=A0A061FIS2_THECC|nr:Uncharacterized protein TCM_036349 [Theobroma cacao]
MVTFDVMLLCVWNANGWEKLASKFMCCLWAGGRPFSGQLYLVSPRSGNHLFAPSYWCVGRTINSLNRC